MLMMFWVGFSIGGKWHDVDAHEARGWLRDCWKVSLLMLMMLVPERLRFGCR